ncbi:hypothetical protein H0H93_002516 [Arthromyces matolae]|nr:hypothetical protein H0H93_002516 [Arthromyces matolae]
MTSYSVDVADDELSPSEIFWHDHYDFFRNHGYTLRRRYEPDWTGRLLDETNNVLSFARPFDSNTLTSHTYIHIHFSMGSPERNQSEPGPSRLRSSSSFSSEESPKNASDDELSSTGDLVNGIDSEGFSGRSEKIVQPLTREALEEFKKIQDQAGVIYISRIPPGMRPSKVRHLMSLHGEIGRVYLQQEDPKRAYLRKKFTTTKKAQFTEGWVEFKDKKVARKVADMLNAQPIGGKKGTRFHDDVWTMKYLPRFKWNMLTEQIAHEAAIHTAKLRVEISQSRHEQQEYLKNVELARVLEKRAEKKQEKGEELQFKPLKEPQTRSKRPADNTDEVLQIRKRKKTSEDQLDGVLSSIF